MPPRYNDSSLSPAARAQALLEQMTLEEKLGQMVLADGRKDAETLVRQNQAGSFLHVLGDITLHLQRIAAETRLGIPLLFGIDAIHGHAFWPGATVFPTQLALSCSWNASHIEQMGRITAREMLVTGMHWTFSPVLCLTRDLRWGRVGETFGEDPYLIGELGKAAIRGYQGEGLGHHDSVAACAKHYAGYSETVGGRDATEADLSRRKLRSFFLPPFEQAVRAGCRTFMTAYQCIDGVPCVTNPWLLRQVLREEWGFEGVLVTDWDNVGRAHKEQRVFESIDAAVTPSVEAGNDLMMVTPEFHAAALAAVREGRLSSAAVDRAALRILTLKFELGLFEHKRFPALERAVEVIGCAKHRAALLPAALESVVLLKNEPLQAGLPPVLPLVAGAVSRVAVLGPNADDPLAQLGDWSNGSGQAGLRTQGHPRESIVTILDGMRARLGADRVSYARGADVVSADASGIPEAVSLALAADVVIVVVGDVLEQIGESCDRSDLVLSGGQLPLLQAVHATGKPLVVVLINSKPLCIPWLAQHAAAIVEAWNPGMEGGHAVAQILFGDFNPCAKLTVSFPRAVGEQPVYYGQTPGWHGRPSPNYDPTPLYAFGFGLSYTSFRYADLRVERTVLKYGDPLVASVEVTNTGARQGTEVAQLYLNDCFTSLSTPSKLLRSFRRVKLSPGQSQTLRFEVPFDDLAFIDGSERAIVEPGEFEVMVGSSSRDVDLLKTSFFYRP